MNNQKFLLYGFSFGMPGDPNEKPGMPSKPEKQTPDKPNPNPDPTTPKRPGNDPYKVDPTRIEEPHKNDPTRIDEPPAPGPEPMPQKSSPSFV
jgi:hypothetical protein